MEQVTIDIRGMIDGYGYQLSNVRYVLRQNKGKEVLCRVNSFGGSVNDAMMIAQEFADHGNVTVRFLGFCASAVTWMAFAAKRIEMAEDGFWLCHRSSITVDIWRQMDAKDLEETIKQLQKDKKNQEAIDLTIAKKYADRSGKSVEDMIALMNEARWLKADEVKELGFVDDIVKTDGKSITKDQQKSIVANCAALHIPAPEFEPENASPSLIERLRRVFSVSSGSAAASNKASAEAFSVSSGSAAANAEAFSANSGSAAAPTQSPQNPQTTMNESFSFINALLKIAGVEVAENKATITVEQLQAIDNALKERDTLQQAINKATATLDAISDNVKDIEGLNNKVLAVKNVLDRVPLTAPAGANLTPAKNEADEKQKAIDESAVDPINAEARSW